MSQSGLSASPAVPVGTVADSGLPFDRLPQPDYDRHPAYGGAFATPTLGLRVKALATLAPWFGLVLVKRLLLFDRLPPLPDYRGPMSGGVLGRLTSVPRYLPLIGRAVAAASWRTLFGRRRIVVPPAGAPVLEHLRRHCDDPDGAGGDGTAQRLARAARDDAVGSS
jgi:hypothetical protein